MMLACRGMEERRDLGRVLALAAPAVTEARIAQTPRARLADAVQYALAPARELLAEPVVEELIERLRQPQQHPRRGFRAGGCARCEDARDLGVVQTGHEGTDHTPNRKTGTRHA